MVRGQTTWEKSSEDPGYDWGLASERGTVREFDQSSYFSSNFMALAATQLISRFGISLQGNGTGVREVGIPVLAGESVESLFGPATSRGREGSLDLFEAGEWLLGMASVPVTALTLERETRALYHSILVASGTFHLARIWNYVPAINAAGESGIENYRVFCRGRSLAFEERLGSGFKKILPSGSAVGTDSNSLTVVFAASRSVPHHFENPLQVPAYEYPEDYGPRSPSFARATVVQGAAASASGIFISGTAAIRGHATMAPGDVRAQLDVTLENLESIAAECGVTLSNAPVGRARMRNFKVYLREARDQRIVAQALESRLLRPGDGVSYLRSDICRKELSVEIEATIFE